MRVLVPYRERDDADRYAAALELVGLEPQTVQANSGATLDACGGLLLTGGSDVNPARYGEARLADTDEPDDERDAAEADLIDEAIARDLPIFGICRGMQMLNVHLGGSLVQHLPTTEAHRKRTPDRGLPAHAVQIEPDTLLARIAGETEWQVNSRHHQAVSRLGHGLKISARDGRDGVVEAVEMPRNRYVLAVQWHPEDQASRDAAQRRLFEAFREAIGG